jgi:putative transposase
VRQGGFYPHSLEKGIRSERALKLALAEMYVQGVSTRKVAAITEQLCGFEVSSAQVSRAAAELDAVLEAWRTRPLGTYPYVYLDARYEKVRQDGQVRDAAVLIASGVDAAGKRAVLGVSVALSEQEVHWRTFLQSLLERGLRGVQLLISDAHGGLKAARLAVFGGMPWQRCQFHLQQNAQAYVPRQDLKREVAAAIRAIFNAPHLNEAKRLLAETVQQYRTIAPTLATWMEENLAEGLMVFAFPEAHRRLIRTTNGLERVNQEIRRRTRVARLFPNEASCLRLITAVVMEISEEWETGKAYLTFDP